ADCAGALDAIARGKDGDAGGVVAAVFEAAQAFYEDGGDVAFGYCADYSAHEGEVSCLCLLLGSVGACFARRRAEGDAPTDGEDGALGTLPPQDLMSAS